MVFVDNDAHKIYLGMLCNDQKFSNIPIAYETNKNILLHVQLWINM